MGLHVEFYADAIEDVHETQKQGRPIHRDVEMVKIQFPGDKKRVLVAYADEYAYSQDHGQQLSYKDRFPDHYKAFKDGVADFVSGTPLAMLGLTPARKAEFEAVHVRTVEALAELSDRDIKNMGMGVREHVEAARDYIAKASENVEVQKLRDQIAALEAQVGKGKPKKPVKADAFSDLSDDDLRSMVADAGGSVPDDASRDTLVAALEKATA